MIAKSKDPVSGANRFDKAGAVAEEQMAFYLRRAFGDLPDVFVINDLRLKGDGDCAQIDHLVQHLYGMFIVESKSISGEVEVNGHGEWVRKWGGRRTGMPCPIQQAKRQRDFLRGLLRQHTERLRNKRIMGYVQPGFKHCPIDVYVAISDKGIIKRRGANPPELMKADQVCDRIEAEIRRHRKAARLLGPIDGDYGVWGLKPDEMQRLTEFLLEQHSPRGVAASSIKPADNRPAPPASARVPEAEEPAGGAAHDGPSCKYCGSRELIATHGKYGYYFKCSSCEKNTPIDYTCTACGKKGRVQKRGPVFRRVCAACNHEEVVWENAAR